MAVSADIRGETPDHTAHVVERLSLEAREVGLALRDRYERQRPRPIFTEKRYPLSEMLPPGYLEDDRRVVRVYWHDRRSSTEGAWREHELAKRLVEQVAQDHDGDALLGVVWRGPTPPYGQPPRWVAWGRDRSPRKLMEYVALLAGR